MLTLRSSWRTALLVTGPATSATSLDVALPSSVPFWWKNPPPLLLVMHWFLMIVLRPVGLKAPPQTCPGTRAWEGVASCKRITKKGTRGICIVFFLLFPFDFLLFGLLFFWFVLSNFWVFFFRYRDITARFVRPDVLLHTCSHLKRISTQD